MLGLIFGFERTAYNFSESVGTGNLGVHLSPDSGLPSENLVFTFSTADSMESNAAVGECMIDYSDNYQATRVFDFVFGS